MPRHQKAPVKSTTLSLPRLDPDFIENQRNILETDLKDTEDRIATCQVELATQCQQGREDADNTSMEQIKMLTHRKLADDLHRKQRDLDALARIKGERYNQCAGCLKEERKKPLSCECDGTISVATLTKGPHYDLCDACHVCKNPVGRKNGSNNFVPKRPVAFRM